MPTFDGGHYFLSALVPVRTGTVDDGFAITSPVHALRKRLDMIPPGAQTPAYEGKQSPFAGNTRNHFARFVIIDDVAYNGREHGNKFSSLFDNLTVAQPQDHLSCPFLFFAVEFDAKSGADSERDAYFAELWRTMGHELRDTFRFCQGFEDRVKDDVSFAKYIADCQLETTMSFNDYYAAPPNLPSWPGARAVAGAVIACCVAIAVGLISALLLILQFLFRTSFFESELHYAVALAGLGVGALVLVIIAAYASIMAAGAKPFPAAPDSNLPTVLKALHLQRAFTRFAIDSQDQAFGTDAASAQKLYDDFATFIADNKPSDLAGPTQLPGVIGF
jgi:hypothetical protein